jgi:hypothetical protein
MSILVFEITLKNPSQPPFAKGRSLAAREIPPFDKGG